MAICVVAVMGPMTAAAQGSDDEARGLFLAGAASYEEGRYADALRYFEHAYALSKRHRMLYNIGQAADRLHYNERAISAFEQYLEHFPEADNEVLVRNRLKALRDASGSAASAPDETEPQPAEEPAEDPEPAEQPATAPTPEEVAQSAPPPVEPAPQAADSPKKESILTQWWLWTALGVVAVGAGVGLGVALGSKTETTAPPPVPTNTGVIVMTLR